MDVSLELQEIDIMGMEQYSEEYMKINPQHTVPFLVDDEFSLSESGAIMMYLADAYGQDDSLYPKDPKQRAIINQRILFDVGTLWMRIYQCYLLPVLQQNMGINDLLIERVNDGFTSLNSFLEDKLWAAGNDISIADFSLVTTVAIAEGVGYDLSKYENVSGWLQRCKTSMTDYDDLIQNAVDTFSAIFAEKLSKIEE